MLINAENLNLYAGDKKILDDISLSIEKGKIIGLIGPNGAGKTSLLKILANVNPDYQGSYTFKGQPISSFKEKQLAKEFGYLPQDATAHWPLKSRRLIELGRLPFQGYSNKLSKEDHKAVEEAAKKTEVEHLYERIATTLSGGERTRVFLARLFAAEPQVIFADEPIAALDPYHQLHIMEILQEHAHSGGTVVIVLHDISLAARFCDEMVLLDEGRIVKTGGINQLLEDELLQKTYGIDLKLFCEGDAYSITPWSRR